MKEKNEERGNCVYIKLDNPYRMKYESPEAFEHSIFSSVYEEAARIVGEIVKKNEEYRGRQKSRTEFQNNEQLYNIVSFTGERGSGKSSCMGSFAEFLKDYSRLEFVNAPYSKFHIADNVGFIGISTIDAGLLEETEDIVEVVLAKLLEEFQKLQTEGMNWNDESDYLKRNFNQCIQEMYESNKRRKQQDWSGNEDEYGSLSQLVGMSVSLNMKEKIKALIEQYIALVKDTYIDSSLKKTNCYVVIPIDDIDVNLERGYKMLEQIRRYLMVPNVIVLLSYRYEQMRDVCRLYYMEGLKGLRKFHAESEVYRNKVEDLTDVYLEKAIPDGRWVNLPEIMEIEKWSDKEIRIIPVNSRESENRKAAHGIEETFMRKVARCFDLRFWYPNAELLVWQYNNFRSLSTSYNALHVLKDPMKEEFGKVETYITNYEWYFNYLKHKANQILDDEEKKYFNDIRACKCQEIHMVILKSGTALLPKKGKIKKQRYSLLSRRARYVYEKSEFRDRIQNLEQNDEMACLEDSLSILRALKKDNKRKKFAELVETYLSGWIREMMFAEKKKNVEMLLSTDIGVPVYDRDIFPLGILRVKGDSTGGANIDIETFREFVIDIKNGKADETSLLQMETVYMFLSRIGEIHILHLEDQLKITIDSFEFSLSNFIWNLLRYEEHLKALEDILKRETGRREFLSYKLKRWVINYPNRQVIPLYNIGFLNYLFGTAEKVMKGFKTETIREIREIRLRRGVSLMKRRKKNSDYNKLLTEFLNGYLQYIKEKLDEQDQYYRNSMREDDEELENLSERFQSCPVIQQIEKMSTKEHTPFKFMEWYSVSEGMIDTMEDGE